MIGVSDPKWGERPKVFVVLRAGRDPSEADILEHVRSRIAHYKAPRTIEFVGELPKTSTGKVQKFELREREWAGETVARERAGAGLSSGRRSVSRATSPTVSSCPT